MGLIDLASPYRLRMLAHQPTRHDIKTGEWGKAPELCAVPLTWLLPNAVPSARV